MIGRLPQTRYNPHSARGQECRGSVQPGFIRPAARGSEVLPRLLDRRAD
jgi:hypothetical protein